MKDRKETSELTSQAEAQFKMADVHRQRWDARRQDSWRVSLAIWTILLLALIQGPGKAPDWAILAFALSVPALHVFGWINPIEHRHDRDMTMIFHHMEKGRSLLGEGNVVRAPVGPTAGYDWFAFGKSWVGVFKAVVSVLLATIFALSSLSGWFTKADDQSIEGGKIEKSSEQSHATEATGASAAMLGQDAQGHGVPIPSGERPEKVSDARGN